ncbi:50S ribosomal protein L1 [Buchnera aphidicola]|uniref:50S ribosomal protein L1 n=1 Tax=Buchnera aphidicola TaxID=9 RepID=UPI0034639860
MSKLTKKMMLMRNNIDYKKFYHINEGILILKKFSTKKFNESVDVSIHLGIDAKKSEQNIRGYTLLPHGIGRTIKVAVFTNNNKYIKEAISANADFIGLEDLAEKIKNKKINFDIVIASPDSMKIVGQLGAILGPRGLMPNPKLGTVTEKIFETVKNTKIGQIRYRNDKNGIVHATIGKINFLEKNIKENLNSLLLSLNKIKPSQSKGLYIRKIFLSTTMGAGLKIDQSTLN